MASFAHTRSRSATGLTLGVSCAALLLAGLAGPAAAAEGDPFTAPTFEGPVGSDISVSGTDCDRSAVVVELVDPDPATAVAGIEIPVDGDGNWSDALRVPLVPGGVYDLVATCGTGSDVSFTYAPDFFRVTRIEAAFPIERGCPPERVPDAGFVDVAPADTHADAIDCLAWYGITQGVAGGKRYEPGRDVPRDQLASFVAGLIDKADPTILGNVPADDPFPCPSNPNEIPEGSVHRDAIHRLAAAGVVRGGPEGRPSDCFFPNLAVTRGQTSSYLFEALDRIGTASVAISDYFTDDNGSVHEVPINAIAELGIMIGYDDATFRPNNAIRRDQMASSLARFLSSLVNAGDIDLPGEPPIAE